MRELCDLVYRDNSRSKHHEKRKLAESIEQHEYDRQLRGKTKAALADADSILDPVCGLLIQHIHEAGRRASRVTESQGLLSNWNCVLHDMSHLAT
jgi:hypothetical protein